MSGLQLQPLRQRFVVSVHAGDITATTGIHPGLQCRYDTFMFPEKRTYPTVTQCVLSQKPGSAIGGTVIHGNYLEINQCLGQQTVHCAPKRRRTMENRHKHADQRRKRRAVGHTELNDFRATKKQYKDFENIGIIG